MSDTHLYAGSEWYCSSCNTSHLGNCPKIKTTLTVSNPVEPIQDEVETVTRYEHGKDPELYMVNGELVAPQANTEQLDELLENYHSDRCRHSQFYEYSCDCSVLRLKQSLAAWNKAIVIAELKGLLIGMPHPLIDDVNVPDHEAIWKRLNDRIAELSKEQADE